MDDSGMFKAGQISTQMQFTDDELALVIKGMSMTLAFLRGKGFSWELASRPLARELDQLQSYREGRKRK